MPGASHPSVPFCNCVALGESLYPSKHTSDVGIGTIPILAGGPQDCPPAQWFAGRIPGTLHIVLGLRIVKGHEAKSAKGRGKRSEVQRKPGSDF